MNKPEIRPIKQAQIDDGIWPVVRWLNSFDDVVTLWSCQGGGDDDRTNSHSRQPYVVFLCMFPDRLLEILQVLGRAGKMEVELYTGWSSGGISRVQTQLRYFFKFTGPASLKDVVRRIATTVRWEHRRLTRLLADNNKDELAKIQHQIDGAAAMDKERRAKEEQAAKEPVIRPVSRDIKSTEVDYHERDLSPVYDIGDLKTKIELPRRTSVTSMKEFLERVDRVVDESRSTDEFWEEAERVVGKTPLTATKEAGQSHVTTTALRDLLFEIVVHEFQNNEPLVLRGGSRQALMSYLIKQRLIYARRQGGGSRAWLVYPMNHVMSLLQQHASFPLDHVQAALDVVRDVLPPQYEYPPEDGATIKGGVPLPPGLAEQTLSHEAAHQLEEMLDNPSENAATGAPLESGDPQKIKPC
jgi:hypothetical protein